MSKNNGGPAFPCETVYSNIGLLERSASSGMSTRDYMAIHATEDDIRAAMTFGDSYGCAEDRVRARYRHADAMLAERAKP